MVTCVRGVDHGPGESNSRGMCGVTGSKQIIANVGRVGSVGSSRHAGCCVLVVLKEHAKTVPCSYFCNTHTHTHAQSTKYKFSFLS